MYEVPLVYPEFNFSAQHQKGFEPIIEGLHYDALPSKIILVRLCEKENDIILTQYLFQESWCWASNKKKRTWDSRPAVAWGQQLTAPWPDEDQWQVVSLWGLFRDQYCLISSSKTQTLGLSAPSQICRWQQAEWCSWHTWGMECHP